MKRLIFSILVLVAITFCYFVFNTVADPEIRTSLALEQFEDPSLATDTAMRAYGRSNLWLYLYIGWFVGTILMFIGSIGEKFSCLVEILAGIDA